MWMLVFVPELAFWSFYPNPDVFQQNYHNIVIVRESDSFGYLNEAKVLRCMRGCGGQAGLPH
jgi:hypothetical protein